MESGQLPSILTEKIYEGFKKFCEAKSSLQFI